jgi:hypothetical protein
MNMFATDSCTQPITYALVFRDCPSFGLYVILYDHMMELMGGKSHVNMFMAGGFAGIVLIIKWNLKNSKTIAPKYRRHFMAVYHSPGCHQISDSSR